MSDMISVAPGFQYSVNIAFDLFDDDKLKNFIPTKSALSLLEDILLSTDPSSTDRARMLIGAYGKGKSHIMLMILSMLMKRDLSLFEKTMPKIKENPRLYQLVENYYDSQNKILPVIICGSNTNLTQAFLISLQRTLTENGLSNSMPETNYHAAVEVIKRWQREFPETYILFQDYINEPAKRFINRLENFDASAYEIFEKVFPELTSGSVFNPFLGYDVPELYENVAVSLRNNGYTGIYVVYDEFSKYLEANITDTSFSDTKMLQDFAEKCNRSGELQMHIMLISHKEISNYIDKLSKQKLDGWKGVSDRFKHVQINNNFSQTYEIISNVIHKEGPLWGEFCKSHKEDFNDLYRRYQKHKIFSDSEEDIDLIIKGCYPLHPISTFVLPRLSERVAQNERTLFTFLSANGEFTLPYFLRLHNDENFKVITPDQIYDYFEPLLKKESYGSNIHTNYILTNTILNYLEKESLESKIVKTISLIYDLEQFEKLEPTAEEIIGIYAHSYDVEKIEDAIKELVEKKYVIYIKRSNGYLRLKKTSGVDIQQKIKDLVISQSKEIEPKDILNASNLENYMYPSRYNDDHAMIRYFAFIFINASELYNDVNWNVKSEPINADGIIYGIIPSNENEIKDLEISLKESSLGQSQYIFVLPKHYKEIEQVVREYYATTALRDQATEDPIQFDEYDVILNDLNELITEFINSYTRPEEYESIYIYNGEAVNIRRKSALTELMSTICDNIFSLTPVINNESVNKEEITNVAATSRNKIISGLLRGELENNLGFIGTGQEVSIMRSTLIRPGIWSEEGGIPKLNLHPDNYCIDNMLSTIENFITEVHKNGTLNFSVLYDQLMSPRYHIGLRRGLIPIYIAVVMHEYRQQIVITGKSGQIPLTTNALIQINAEPDNYNLEYLDWDPDKESYIKRLSLAFSDYIVEEEKKGNAYDYVANAMRRWYMSLPKYSKECKTHPFGGAIEKQQLEMIKLLRQNIGGSDLLFKKIPNTFGYRGRFNADIANEIIETKNLYEGLLGELKKYLSNFVKALFIKPIPKDIEQKTSLTSVLKEWYDSLDPSVFEQLFADGTNKFLELLKEMTNDENLFISRIAKLATDLRIEDWDDKTHELFEEVIIKFKETAEDFHSDSTAEKTNTTNNYEVSFSDEDGRVKTRRFEKVEISPRGRLLFNQVTASIEAMGQSISEQEKRQVLMEILKKLC